MSATEFDGFKPSLLRFLRELSENNDRDWFNANKQRYESQVLEPALGFIAAMGPRLGAISRRFLAVPRRTGGSLMRVYRDTRFSPDKRPYKTNVGIQFRHERGKDVHAPGYYVHLEPGEAFLGVGLWRPDRDALAGIRDRIAHESEEWVAARNALAGAAGYELGGDSLKRAPRDYPEDHPLIEDLKRTDFIASRRLLAKQVQDPGFVDLVSDSFAAATPFMQFLCKAVDVPF